MGELRDPERTAGEQEEERQRQKDAEQTEFLGEHGEHEIGMRFWEVEELLYALTEPDAGPSATTDGDQALHQLESAVELVRPRIEERQQPADAIRLEHRDRRHHRGHDERQPDDITEPGTGDEQHAEPGRDQHYGRTEIRLEQQQAGDHRQHRQRLDHADQGPLQFGFPSHRVTCHPDQHHDAG